MIVGTLVCSFILIICSVLQDHDNADIKFILGFVLMMLAQIASILEKIEKHQRRLW